MLILALIGLLATSHDWVQASHVSSASLPEIYQNIQFTPSILKSLSKIAELYKQNNQNSPGSLEYDGSNNEAYYDDVSDDPDCLPGQNCAENFKEFIIVRGSPDNTDYYENLNYVDDGVKDQGSFDTQSNVKFRIYQKSADKHENKDDKEEVTESVKHHVTEEPKHKSTEHQKVATKLAEDNSNKDTAPEDAESPEQSNNEDYYETYDEYAVYPEVKKNDLSDYGNDESSSPEEDYLEKDDLDLEGQDYIDDDYVELEDILQNGNSFNYVEIDQNSPVEIVQSLQTGKAEEYADYQDYPENDNTNYSDDQNDVGNLDNQIQSEMSEDHGQFQIVGSIDFRPSYSDYGQDDENYHNFDQWKNQQTVLVQRQSKNYFPLRRLINVGSILNRDTVRPFKNSKFLSIPEDVNSAPNQNEETIPSTLGGDEYPADEVDENDLESDDFQYATNPDYVDNAINGGNYDDYDQIENEKTQENGETENQGSFKTAEKNIQALGQLDKNEYQQAIPENPVNRIIENLMHRRRNRHINENMMDAKVDINKNLNDVDVLLPAFWNKGSSFGGNNRSYFQYKANQEPNNYPAINKNQLTPIGFKMEKSFTNPKIQGQSHTAKVGAPRFGVNSNNHKSLFNARNQPIQVVHDYTDYEDAADYFADSPENNAIKPHPDILVEKRRRQELRDLEDLKHLKKAREDRVKAKKLNDERRKQSNRRLASTSTISPLKNEEQTTPDELKINISYFTTPAPTKKIFKSTTPKDLNVPQMVLKDRRIIAPHSAAEPLKHPENNPLDESYRNPILKFTSLSTEPEPIIQPETPAINTFNESQQDGHEDKLFTNPELFPTDEHPEYEEDFYPKNPISEETPVQPDASSNQDDTEYDTEAKEDISKTTNKYKTSSPKRKKKHLKERKSNSFRRPIFRNPIIRPVPIYREPIRRKQPRRTRKVIRKHRSKPKHVRKSKILTSRRQRHVKG